MTTKKPAKSPAAPGLGAPAPSERAPSPPPTFDPRAKEALGRTFNPRHAHIELAPKIAAEVARPEYDADFGGFGPDAEATAQSLEKAHAWSAQVRDALLWVAYARYQEHLAWLDAYALTGALKPSFEARRKRDGTLVARYPALTQFFDARKEAALKGAEKAKTKKKRGA